MIERKINQIKNFYFKNRRLPSYSEMMSLFGYSSKKSVFDLVKKMVVAGYLTITNKKLAPTKKFFSLPLYGLVKAGFPIIAEEDRQYLTLDEYLIEDFNSSFLLKVSGDSLINLGIFDGDIVVVEKKGRPTPGDVVLAEIDREWTLKIYRQDPRKKITYLESANPKYPPLFPKKELLVHGIVKGLVRKIK